MTVCEYVQGLQSDLWKAKNLHFLLFRCLLILPGGMWGSSARKECMQRAEPWQLWKERMTLRVSAKRSLCWVACVLDGAQHNAGWSRRGEGGRISKWFLFCSTINLLAIGNYSSILAYHSPCKKIQNSFLRYSDKFTWLEQTIFARKNRKNSADSIISQILAKIRALGVSLKRF